MKTFSFKSSSSNAEYTTVLADDGKLLCDCKGWTVRKGDKPRHCKHTKEIAGTSPIDVRGEFVYLANGATPAAPQPIAQPVGQVPAPMLASAMTDTVTGVNFDARYDGSEWVMETKIDGHRCVVVVEDGVVSAFSRPQRGKTAGNRRDLPPAMIETLRTLPNGIYDGELVAAQGGKSWNVQVSGATLVFVAFDILKIDGHDLTRTPYGSRRGLLLGALSVMPKEQQSVSTVEQFVPCWRTIEEIWAKDGEGVILKRKRSTYQPGDRSADWIKVKAKAAATLELVGFEAGKSGPCSAMRLRDGSGVETTVKTLTNALLAQVTKSPEKFIGRRVVISYQERTNTGTYRHPQFDHFAGAAE